MGLNFQAASAIVPPVEVFSNVQLLEAPLKFSLKIETVVNPPLAVKAVISLAQTVADDGVIVTAVGFGFTVKTATLEVTVLQELIASTV